MIIGRRAVIFPSGRPVVGPPKSDAGVRDIVIPPQAVQVGATTAQLQARLGHSTSVAAQLYQHAAKDRDRQIAERLSRLVGGT